ncbi:MAG TPA: CvpA family protein [Planctomycetes bacterium]|nr:CvpA family protein [Planctomycetota bacterium]
MIFILAVIVGVVFAVIGIRNGFFGTWLLLFNILVSIYVGVMLSPTLAAVRPDMEQNYYYLAGFVGVTTVMIFIVLETVAVIFFGELGDCFCPKLFDTAGAGVLGFLAGFCILSFVYFIVCIMPFSQKPFMRGVFGDGVSAPAGVEPVVKTCNFVSTTSLQPYCGYKDVAGDVVNWLVIPDHELESKPLHRK